MADIHTNLVKSVESADEFRMLLNTICQDLGRILDKWTLFRQLGEAQLGPYTKAMTQSQSFWSMVLGSLQDASVFALCRAYDDHRDALTLRSVVETLISAPPWGSDFPTIPRPQLESDLESVDRRTSPTVKNLLMWRDNFFAHRSPTKIVKGRTLADDAPLTYGDIDALIENGFRIVNSYGSELFRVSNARKMVGADDYLELLRTLQRDAEAHEASW